MSHQTRIIIALTSLLLVIGSTFSYGAETGLQKEINEIKGVLPKLVVPMREVGDRFHNMYYAAHGGNWGLAGYMSKHIKDAMDPTKVTEAKIYEDWKAFYETMFGPINKAILVQDIGVFEREYNEAIESCNLCHVATRNGFIKVIKLREPADKGIDYLLKTKATGEAQ
jgi:hypothetical protein